MIKSRNTKMSRVSKPVAENGGDPAEIVVQAPQPQADEGYQGLDNSYETAGFAISEVFKNWKKTLIIILTILLLIGLILLALLPGYKCQTKAGSFEKSPVNLPGKGYTQGTDSNYDEGTTYGN